MTVRKIQGYDRGQSGGARLCNVVVDGDEVYLEGKNKKGFIRASWEVVLKEVELAKLEEEEKEVRSYRNVS